MSTLLITGSGGIGVSRLIDEAERRIGGLPERITVVRCRSRPGRIGDPYAPVVEGLGRVLGRLPDLDLRLVVGSGAEVLSQLMPDLSRRLDGLGILPPMPSVTESERRLTRALESILGVFSRIGERTPLIVTLEDLQWADPGTRALATFLARVSRPGRLSVIATYQPDEMSRQHPLHAALADMADAARPPDELAVGPLQRDELADLIAGIEGERPSASILLLVAERSLGNPLIAEELLAARRELAGASLTGSLEELVMARLAQRTPECRRLLRLLAPAGETLRIDELAAATAAFEAAADRPAPRSSAAPRRGGGLLEADLAVGLAEAIDHGFILVDAEHSPESPLDVATLGAEASVTFRHELIARAVEADLLPNLRRRHHAAIAAGLVGRPGSQSRHWLAGHEYGAAFQSALAAASIAESMGAPGTALGHLELAIELDSPDGDVSPLDHAAPRSPAGLRARAAEAAFGDGRPTRATAYAEAAIALLDERSDRLALALLHERLGRYRRASGDQEGSIIAHRRAVSLVPGEPSVERALVLASLAQVRMLAGMFSEAERLCREAIECARQVGFGGRAWEGHAICTLGISRAWGDDPETGIALIRDARAIADELGRVDDSFRATANLMTALDLLGRRREAVDVAMTGIKAAREAGQEASYGNFLRGNGADSLFLLGRWAESRELSETALEWSPVGVNFINAISNLAILEIESDAGEVAGRLLGRLLLELETVPDAQDSVPAYRAAASFALWRGDLGDARRAVELGWARVRETEDWVLMARMAATVLEVDAATVADAHDRRELSSIAQARERSSRVLAEVDAAVSRAGVASSIGSRQEADAYVATARAFRARLDGRDEPVAWDALARRWDQLGLPYEAARARWRQAEAALTSADGWAAKTAAKKPLLEALRSARQLGAHPLLRELEELGTRALIKLPQPAVNRNRLAVPVEAGDELAVAVATPTDADLRRTDVAEGPLDSWPTAATGTVRHSIARGLTDGGRRSDDRPIGDDRTASSAAGSSAAEESGHGQGGHAALAAEFIGPAQPRRDTFGLSAREKEVLLLLSKGRTNREIGERLFISQKTVGVHVGNILSKLGVSGRVEAAAVAIRLSLTDRS